MHDGTLMDLLAEVFTTHGYDCTRQAALEGRSGTVYTIPLLAESEERAVIIDADLGSDPLDPEAVAAVEDVLHDVGAHHAVLCHLGLADESDADVALWGHDMLLQVIGDAKLSQALGTPPERLRFQTPSDSDAVPIAESLDEIMPEAFHDASGDATQEAEHTDDQERPRDMAPEPQRFGDQGRPRDSVPQSERFGDQDHSRKDRSKTEADDPMPFDLDALAHAGTAGRGAEQDHDTPAPPGPSSEDIPLEDDMDGQPEPAPAFVHPLLPVRVTSDEARLAIRERLETVDSVQMALQPVHLIDYECDLLAEGSLRYDTVRGRVQVHGTDKVVTEVDPEAVDPQGFTRMARLPGLPNHERTLRVSDDNAKQRTTDFLLENHARIVDIEVDDEDNGFSYTEKKRVAPRPDHVRLDPLGTFHRVIWRFVGPQGHIDVDALDGSVVDEVLQHPHTDSMMIE